MNTTKPEQRGDEPQKTETKWRTQRETKQAEADESMKVTSN
jgi:hypothetical protein